MKATDVLMEEHRVIEQVLDCLEKLADRADDGAGFDKTSVLESLDFFRTFADGCHHGKEEKHLFPMLESRGFSRQGGPTGVMLHEHEEGRGLMAAMTAAVERDAPADFVRHARAYVRLLREHIRKEDHCLFPMAAGVLRGVDAERLAQSFMSVENADMGEGVHQRYLDLASALAERLGVTRAAAEPAACAHACSHHNHR